MSGMEETPALHLEAPREQVLERAAALIVEAWRSFDHPRADQPPIDDRVWTMLQAPLPEGPADVAAVLDDAARILDETIAQPRPRYFAFVGSSGLEIGVIGDALAACFDANMAVYAGAASEIEDQAVRWVGELIGFPTGGGAFTSGGTVSNLTALAAAREWALPGSRVDGHGRDQHRRLLLAGGALLGDAGGGAARHRRPPGARRCRLTSIVGCCRRRSPRRSTPTAPRASHRSPSLPRQAPR